MERITPILIEHFDAEPTVTMCAQAVDALEAGSILLLPYLSFKLLAEETQFLTAQAVEPKRKNVSYDWRLQKTKGDSYIGELHQKLQQLLARYANQANILVNSLFPHYTKSIQLARTSYRPVEAFDRTNLSNRKDDRLLHTDAFPASPTQGWRILRVFSNINLNREPRVWRVGENFEKVAARFLPHLKTKNSLVRHLLNSVNITRGLQTNYDAAMLQLHDLMKKDQAYQDDPLNQMIELPAETTWLVFTDQVPHAVISGQFCLEQTFYLPVQAMTYPERSPLKILERLMNKPLV
ncbi:MAG: hypothetical protein A3E87_03060 [Gammaproteobacteria bacterium RIFCSPHIGHO2_12_FULL_35_23]|nr:MAG: hypothetical protein A3E87_03060 [Gammaproteobacteria bacterium RIFCSPHIGHO2_12_FULL_35_23]